VFLVFQYPFADIRWFLGAESGRLTRPFWPLAKPEEDFVRSSGIVKSRRHGGAAEWAGEELYGDATSALRFPDHLGQMRFFNGKSITSNIYGTSRRYHSDGMVARLEVGLHIRDSPYPSCYRIKNNPPSLLDQVQAIPVRVSDMKKQTHIVKLIEAGDILAEHYLAATTNCQLRPKIEPEPWWLCAGTPAIIAVHNNDKERLELEYRTRDVLQIPNTDIRLSHALLKFGDKECSAWFIDRGAGGFSEIARRLRIHLIRLHAERECLRLVLFHISDGEKLNFTTKPNLSDSIQLYLNNAIRAIEKPKRFGLNQLAIIETAQVAFDMVSAGYSTSLQHMRRQVAMKVKAYIQKANRKVTIIQNIERHIMSTVIKQGNITVSGNFTMVTAKNIENSLNTTENNELDQELKSSLELAIKEVTRLINKLPDREADTTSRDLDNFITEVTSEKPRKEWYQLSAKGMLETAKTVAQLTHSVTAAINTVLIMLNR